MVLGGENALPCFSPNGVDAVALERIVYNTQVRACSWHDIQIPCMAQHHLRLPSLLLCLKLLVCFAWSLRLPPAACTMRICTGTPAAKC